MNQLHKTLTWKYQLIDIRKEQLNKYKIKFDRRGDFKSLNKAFIETNWIDLFDNKDADESYNIFIKSYLNSVNQYIPLKKNCPFNLSKSAPGWLNTEITRASREKYKI